MNQRVVGGLSRALLDSDLIATRLGLFLAELCWAVMLFWPGETFGRPTYDLMGRIAPEEVWALMFIVSACLQMHIVIFEVYHTTFAHWFARWNALLWVATVGMMLGSVYPPPAAIGGEIALMVSAVWIAVRPSILAKGERHAAGAEVRQFS